LIVRTTIARRPRGFQGLGDTSNTPVQVDTADVLSLGDQLRAAQARLTNLFQQMQSDSTLAAAIGRDVTAQQAQLGDLIAKYVGVYNGIFGQNPVGLGNPVLVAAAVAVILAYVGANLYLWYQKQATLEAQAQAQIITEQNRASVINMAAQQQNLAATKAAAGDSVGAADAAASAQAMLLEAGVPGTPPPPPAPATFSDWLQANWITVAVIGGAIFVLPKILNR
jgi:hypothetical protein